MSAHDRQSEYRCRSLQVYLFMVWSGSRCCLQVIMVRQVLTTNHGPWSAWLFSNSWEHWLLQYLKETVC